MGEEPDPQVGERPLADPAREVGLQRREPEGDEPDDDERGHDPGELLQVAGLDPLVDGELREERRHERDEREREQRGDRARRARPGTAARARTASRGAAGVCRHDQSPTLPPRSSERCEPACQTFMPTPPPCRHPDLLEQPELVDLAEDGARARAARSACPARRSARARARRPCRRARSSRAGARSRSSCGRASPRSSPARISDSVVASTEAVASSRIRMRGSITSARAIASRWRCPPESVIPRSPITVS